MELVYLERRDRFHDNGATPEFSGRSEGYNQHLPDTPPEVQSDLGQIHYKKTLPSDEKKIRSCQSCHGSPCACGADAPHSDLCPTLPAKMMTLEFLIRSLRNPTRTHNVSDLDDLIGNGASTENVTLGPSDKMMLDSLHAMVSAKTRPKSPSFFLPGAKMRKIRSRSHIITQSEILKLISPETWEMSSPGASPLKKSMSEFSVHEKMALSCSNTASISSDQHLVSSYPSSSLSAGLLECIWKDGLPHFELSLDNPMTVYTASPIKASDNGKAVDYVYFFHSGEQSKKDWMGNTSSISRLVGKMKVSSSIVLNPDKSSSIETEFVMYGSPDDYLRQMQSPYSVTKGKGLVKRVTEIMKQTSVSSSPKHVRKFGNSYSQQYNDLAEGELSIAKVSGLANLMADDLPTNQEIAAIVVRQQQHEHRKEPIVGGWGLKFLEKAGATHSEGSRDANVQSSKGTTTRCVNAIVPRGYHGGTASNNGGPSGLVERWRSGGCCDCGGWDLGCPIRVLNNDYSSSSPQSQDSKSVELSVKGVRKNEPMLRLVNVVEDLYILYFDSSISPLQFFSTGIAMIHSEAPQLLPKILNRC